MKEFDDQNRRQMVQWQEKLLRTSVRRRIRAGRLCEAVGTATNRSALEIGMGDAGLAVRLRQTGGDWHHVGIGPDALRSLDCVTGGPAGEWSPGGGLPFDDGSFELVVVDGALEWVEDESAFIRECHRVLQTDGRLILDVRHARRFSLMHCWRVLLGERRGGEGGGRAGYTAHHLFDLLKDGFDVPGIDRYSGFFVELLGALATGLLRLGGAADCFRPQEDDQSQFYRYQKVRLVSLLGMPLFMLADLLDRALFFLPRYRLLATTKRRVWRERRIPKLRDGRSIAEAAINTRIGSAAPF
ncbi:class I SAM-dependent methyltransferase [Kiritimatiella glycovorans]|uniref:Methyltransferase type 11 domain-containing protein n=1 Tax=Kiritimatiella glycovorans TaxID=1307763 RepID=A0A0G3EI60_9BACT|nr:methyltransferase domain-containing protein [Kiritimatiella glycovorans]AKJ63819.1 hypothetical protein L21SP4_00547 [Kiritimatiella glycovorans]